ASICEALDIRMSDLLREVSDQLRRSERTAEVAGVAPRTLVPAGVGGPARRPGPLPRPGADRAGFGLDGPFEPAGFDTGLDTGFDTEAEAVPAEAPADGREPDGREVAALDLAGLDAPGAPEVGGVDGVDMDRVDLDAPTGTDL